MASKIQTKKNEAIITTSDTSLMHKKYLVNNLFRTWPEPYVDSDTEEIKHAVYSFYSVEVNAKLGEDNERDFRFLVYARDVDNAKVLIEKFLRGKVKDTPYAQLLPFVDVLAAEALLQINVISATKVKCHSVIGLEFTEAYNTKKEEEPVEEEAIDLDIE